MATATATFESLNPSTGEVIETFPRAGKDEVDRAVDIARAAWEEWRLVPAPERGNDSMTSPVEGFRDSNVAVAMRAIVGEPLET